MDSLAKYQAKENYIVPMTPAQRAGHLHPVLFQEHEGMIRGKDVLDVGCNQGDLTFYLHKLSPKSLCGADVNPAALEAAKAAIPNARFECCPVQEMPFEDDSFDTVVMFEVFEHLYEEDKKASLAELARVLRPGGLVFLSMPKAVPGSKDEKLRQNAYDPHHVSFYFKEGDVHADFVGWECLKLYFENRSNPGNKSQRHCSWVGVYKSPE
jgi:ubiquinone/menaquinone biosynthesis C-methylase UbiE